MAIQLHQIPDPTHLAPVSRIGELENAIFVVNRQFPKLTAPVPMHGRLAAIVGDSVQLSLPVAGAAVRFELVRQPPAEVDTDASATGTVAAAKRAIQDKAGEIVGGAVPLRRPGLHLVRAWVAQRWSTEIVIAAFPVGALDRLRYPQDPMARIRRLQCIIGDDRVTMSSIVAALELGDGRDGISGVLLGAPDTETAPQLDVGQYA